MSNSLLPSFIERLLNDTVYEAENRSVFLTILLD